MALSSMLCYNSTPRNNLEHNGISYCSEKNGLDNDCTNCIGYMFDMPVSAWMKRNLSCLSVDWRAKLRKVIAGILMVATLGAQAAPVPKHVLTHDQSLAVLALMAESHDDDISYAKYLKNVKACAASGNVACIGEIGTRLYQAGQYREAYPLLLVSQGGVKLDSVIKQPFTVGDCALGDMFRFGDGVMQDTDKAIQYYRIGASFGNEECVTGLMSSYAMKFISSNIHDTSFRSNLVLSTAWGKVALGMGIKSYQNTDGHPVSVASKSQRDIQSGNDLFGNNFERDVNAKASIICSTIDECIQ